MRRNPEMTREHQAIPENPYLQNIYNEIEDKIDKLKLPEDQIMQAIGMLLEIAQKQLQSTPEPQKAYFQIHEFISNIKNQEELFTLIDTINQAKLEKIVQFDNEKSSGWDKIDQEKITRWKEGTTKLKPEEFSDGDYVAFARINQAQNQDAPLYYYSISKDSPQLPSGIIGEVEYFKVITNKLGKLVLEKTEEEISLSDSSEKLRANIIRSNPEFEFYPGFHQEISPDYEKNVDVKKDSSVDGSIQKDQPFIYNSFELKGSGESVFAAKILGINNEGNVVVEKTDGSQKKFAIERKTWEKLRKIDAEGGKMYKAIEYVNDETESAEIFNFAKTKQTERMEKVTEFDNDPETQKINDIIFYNNIEREFDNLKKGNIQPENLVNFILEKTNFKNATERNDAKELLTLRFEMLVDSHKSKSPKPALVKTQENSEQRNTEENKKLVELVRNIRENSEQKIAA